MANSWVGEAADDTIVNFGSVLGGEGGDLVRVTKREGLSL